MARTQGAHTRLLRRHPRARDRAWAAMRVLRRFSLPELVATAEIGQDNARKYIIGLRRAGYVRVAEPKRNGHKGGHEVYQLVRNTGPYAPRLQSDGRTYDPNLHQVHEGGLGQ